MGSPQTIIGSSTGSAAHKGHPPSFHSKGWRQLNPRTRGATSRGNSRLQPGNLRTELTVEDFELEHAACSRQVEASGQEIDNAANAQDVVVAVPPHSARSTSRGQKPLAFVEAQYLLAQTGQYRGESDAVNPRSAS